MAVKPIHGRKEYTCLSTDTKPTATSHGVTEGSTLVELNSATGALKGYIFINGDWRGGWTI
jgi:hypothetical protein